MPIEFRCHQCGTLLRTGDDTAGKQARCPTCANVMPIPAATTGPAFESGFRPPPPGMGAANPYQSPGGYQYDAVETPAQGSFQPTVIDFGDIFSRTWSIFQTQWGICLLVLFVVLVFNVVVSGTITVGLLSLGFDPNDNATGSLAHSLGNLVQWLISTWIGIGQALIFLGIARGEPIQISQLFSGGRFYPRILGAFLLASIPMMAGFLLLIIPGVFLLLMFWPFYWLIIDRNVGIVDSFDLAMQITRGNKATVLLIAVVMFLLTLVSIIPCGLGLLVTMPLFTLMWAVVYLAMTGQPTADQRYWRMRESVRDGR
ncbi:MAG: hypothetical protein U1E05_20135 [Patescibacteria group bacterium]|nr:hypothetical protein [Patescibacteria group bacterium]